MRRLFHLYQRLMSFYRFGYFDCRRNNEDLDKTDFMDVWSKAAPEEFINDHETARRIGDLVKFKAMTYDVNNF